MFKVVSKEKVKVEARVEVAIGKVEAKVEVMVEDLVEAEAMAKEKERDLVSTIKELQMEFVITVAGHYEAQCRKKMRDLGTGDFARQVDGDQQSETSFKTSNTTNTSRNNIYRTNKTRYQPRSQQQFINTATRN